MINEIHLDGFKSFYDEYIELKGLTMLTGLNSSGKSTVIQAIAMAEKMRSSNGCQFILKGHGAIKELINSSQTSFNIEIAADSYSVSMSSNMENTKVEGDITDNIFSLEAGRIGGENAIAIYNESSEIGTKGENVLKCIDAYRDTKIPSALQHEQSEGTTFGYNLKAWLSIISPGVAFDYSVQEMADTSFSTFDGHRSANVGFGLSYTLPVIALLLRASIISNSIVLLENPEAHLHPKGQTEMGRLIACAVDAGVQVIVETHSDHLFEGIRLYAKEKGNFADKFIGYWIEKEDNSTAFRIEISDNGKLKEKTPKGFFDQFEINSMKLI
jgi:predicted ATPase